MSAQCNLGIRHAQVGIEQHDLVALHRQRYGQIDGHRGFTRAPFAAGHTDHLWEFFLVHFMPQWWWFQL